MFIGFGIGNYVAFGARRDSEYVEAVCNTHVLNIAEPGIQLRQRLVLRRANELRPACHEGA